MSYKAYKEGDQWCVYKHDDAGPLGKSLGCHPSKKKAEEQIAAILAATHSRERGEQTMTGQTITRPYPGEHAARIHDPASYDHFRRENDKFGKGIDVIWGIKTDGTTEVQAIRFDAKKFTPAKAKKWLKDHDYKPIQFEEATKEAAMSSRIARIWEGVQRLFEPELEGTTERTTAMGVLMSKVREQLDVINETAIRVDPHTGQPFMDWNQYTSLMDVYYDDDQSLFALLTQAGKIYRAALVVDAFGGVTMGAPAEIPLTARIVPGAKAGLTVIRSADGKLRWFAVAASAVLNRVNEIDSTALFDNFISRAEGSGEYPVLSFYHEADVIRFGQASWLGRDGYLYLAVGEFDDTEIARIAAAKLEGDGKDWGLSIGYLPIGEPDLLEAVPGVDIPVYTDGINREISIVLERDAAAWFTRISTEEVKRTMNARELQALTELLGEAKAKEIAAQVDGTNRTIEAAALIARTAQATPPAPAAATAPVPAPVAAAAPIPGGTNAPAVAARPDTAPGPLGPKAPVTRTDPIELDDSAVAAIVTKLTDSAAFKELQAGIVTLTASVGTLDKSRTAMELRLQDIEKTEEEKRREWVTDLPAQPPVRATYRPREVHKTAEAEASSEEIAKATVGKMSTRALPSRA